MERFDVVIVGGGHGGAQAAIVLRQIGFAGSVLILTDEPELPYERPPLSKDYLLGQKTFERMLIRPTAFWDERAVEVRTSARVVAVDATAQTVTTACGERIGYGDLVWAAGGAARALGCDGAELAGVHAIRTRGDVDALLAELDGAERAVVIGGGYIGLEAAAALRKLGKSVTLLEAAPRVLARVAGAPISTFYEAEHRAAGVDLRTGVMVTCLEGESGRVCGVRLADGAVLPADLVVVGIGIVPNVMPLIEAGAVGTNGVDVDAQCRTSLLHVYAVGDCAGHRNLHAEGARIRVESVQNATDQATVAAKAIAGTPEDYAALPWFWSNQYDLKLQTVGLSAGADQVVVRGDPQARSFSAVYLKGGRVVALDCVNAVKDYVAGRKLILERVTPDPVRLADASVPLKEIAG